MKKFNKDINEVNVISSKLQKSRAEKEGE